MAERAKETFSAVVSSKNTGSSIVLVVCCAKGVSLFFETSPTEDLCLGKKGLLPWGESEGSGKVRTAETCKRERLRYVTCCRRGCFPRLENAWFRESN